MTLSTLYIVKIQQETLHKIVKTINKYVLFIRNIFNMMALDYLKSTWEKYNITMSYVNISLNVVTNITSLHFDRE